QPRGLSQTEANLHPASQERTDPSLPPFGLPTPVGWCLHECPESLSAHLPSVVLSPSTSSGSPRPCRRIRSSPPRAVESTSKESACCTTIAEQGVVIVGGRGGC